MKNAYDNITVDVIPGAPSPWSGCLEAVDITLFSVMEQDARTGP
jgi:hypothetical protein